MGEHRRLFRFFTIPEYEKEEKWLQEQHAGGWALVRVAFPGIYYFTSCKPENVVYQLDYNKEGNGDKASYTQMFSDFGWEHITEFVGYSYFRKPREEMVEEGEGIFSDADSKLEMSKRVFRGRMVPLLIIFTAVIIPQLSLQLSYGLRPLLYIYIGLFGLYVFLFAWFGIHYWKQKQKTIK